MDNWFTIDKIDANTYIISEYRHWEETHCYLLNGNTRSLFRYRLNIFYMLQIFVYDFINFIIFIPFSVVGNQRKPSCPNVGIIIVNHIGA